MKFIYLLALVVMLSVSVSAWPYELYSNGTIVDLNSSNNQSTNLTIYFYNVTYENITEHNNITNINQTINLSNYYTKAETEGRYLRLGSQYGNTEVFSRAEVTELITTLNNTDVNITAQLNEINETPVGWLWGGIIIAILLAVAALILIGKDNY